MIKEHQLYIQREKCEFFTDKVEFLGHFISADGAEMDPDKVKAIIDWPTPNNKRDIMSFLGLANYYRKFVKGFSAIVKPISDLLKEKINWQWGKEQDDTMAHIKVAITTAPIL